jgi:hypothetical protein
MLRGGGGVAKGALVLQRIYLGRLEGQYYQFRCTHSPLLLADAPKIFMCFNREKYTYSP